jgi:hypothetical protein
MLRTSFLTTLLTLLLATGGSAQKNILSPYRIDSLPSTANGFGETDSHYIFSASYSLINQTGFPFEAGKLISVDKLTQASTTLYFPRTGDTSFSIVDMAVIHDTIHTVLISLWHELPADIYHYALYTQKYNDQLQQISSKLIRTIDDTLKVYHHSPLMEFKDDVYMIFETFGQPQWNPPGSLVYYSVYERSTDNVLVDRMRLNPDPFSSPVWIENVNHASTDEGGNVIVSMHALGGQMGTYYSNVLAVLSNSDQYQIPQGIRYQYWDSTLNYEMAMTRLPFAEKEEQSYYFISKSTTNYFLNPSLNNGKLGVYKGRFRDSCIVMDTSYNTSRNLSYTTMDGSARIYGDALRFLNDSSLIFTYAGNDDASLSYFNPCQSWTSGLEIVVLDTNLIEKKTHTIVNSYYNAGPKGFDITREGNIVVWGNLCPAGGTFDSLTLFAFLLDPETGFPVNIFNGSGFVNADRFEVYPNPSAGLVTISGLAKEGLTIEIYDITGRNVLQRRITEDLTVLDIGNLSPGVYVYQLRQQGSVVQTGRILKE